MSNFLKSDLIWFAFKRLSTAITELIYLYINYKVIMSEDRQTVILWDIIKVNYIVLILIDKA